MPVLALALRLTSTAANAGWLSSMLARVCSGCIACAAALIHRVQADVASRVARRVRTWATLAICDLIVNADAIAERSRYQHTPLHLSASGSHLETCRLLLQSSADSKANKFW